MPELTVGSIVKCRDREWVVMPPPDPQIILLRPLTGSEEEVCGIYLPLVSAGLERIEQASFPLPQPQDAGDAVSAELLWNAARLALRDGASPFRSLGRISFRPRAYQFVPLLMALRLDPIRMLIADDVGIGKTIEALLIVRELLDRGEIRRLCVLCPPYLCDQWQKELWEKFQINAVVICSGTVNQLERELPQGHHSIFGYFPFIVVSIDYAKMETHRANFLQHCPEMVIVDEAHGAAQPPGQNRGQQQRHELLKQVAAHTGRHIILLTATPHSGVEESFRSLLGLIKPCFAQLNLQNLSDAERDELARHFVQRRRADVTSWLGENTPFPKRESAEETYELSPKYRQLFDHVYRFSRELVRSSESLTGWKQRIRYWAALALLRCVMSSPAAARAALRERMRGLSPKTDEDVGDDAYAPYIYEPTDEDIQDTQPSHIVEESATDFSDGERRQLRNFETLAAQLCGSDDDRKMTKCAQIVADLLRKNYHPIVWCRYIATSDYVAEQLQARLKGLFPDLRILSITGALAEDERRHMVEELAKSPRRVLVATDCLSEGINLQEHFTAVLHYDLPWNPNRLEQREGRVDRFGQPSPTVIAVLLYGRDNPVDGAVLDILLRKAKEIHKSLGILVPVPMDSETVMNAVLKALFFRAPALGQKMLFEEPIVQDVLRRWSDAAAREKESRTKFAQRAIKPDEVQREIMETDSILGDPIAVKRFVLAACQRLGLTARETKNDVWVLTNLRQLPEFVRSALPDLPQEWRVTFNSPAPEKVVYLGRNHPFVSALAQYLLESALAQGANAPASRCGVIKTGLVSRRTTLFLLRLRYLLESPNKSSLLAEEVYVCGYRGITPNNMEWLSDTEALNLLQEARPQASITPQERTEILSDALASWQTLQSAITQFVIRRKQKLEESHKRIRAAAHLSRRGFSLQPSPSPDLLGILVLQPIPKEAKP